jgi:hypothetical protein
VDTLVWLVTHNVIFLAFRHAHDGALVQYFPSRTAKDSRTNLSNMYASHKSPPHMKKKDSSTHPSLLRSLRLQFLLPKRLLSLSLCLAPAAPHVFLLFTLLKRGRARKNRSRSMWRKNHFAAGRKQGRRATFTSSQRNIPLATHETCVLVGRIQEVSAETMRRLLSFKTSRI